VGKRWRLVAGVLLILALTGTLGLVSHERLSRQEALDAAAVTEIAGRGVDAKLMHFSDLTRAYPAIGQASRPDEKLIGGTDLVWVIVISGYLFSGSCGAPITAGSGQCEPNWTLLVVRDSRTDLPPPKRGQAGTRASIIQASYSDKWPSFFHALPDLQSVPILF
jgi:hypothetical protein